MVKNVKTTMIEYERMEHGKFGDSCTVVVPGHIDRVKASAHVMGLAPEAEAVRVISVTHQTATYTMDMDTFLAHATKKEG